jgi:hypothetical protein
MDHVILLYLGGSVNEQFELIGMRRYVLIFEKPSQFKELVCRARSVLNVGCKLRLLRRYDMGGIDQCMQCYHYGHKMNGSYTRHVLGTLD